LTPADFPQWNDVRVRNERWLTPWEPLRLPNSADPTRNRDAFSSRCATRDRERQVGSAYGFGLFVDNAFAGEININNVVRGAFQCGVIGYWIDERHAGKRYVAEGVVALARFAFEELHLHRLEICIVPRNTNSRRVMEVLNIRSEGVALRYLEINGTWEDHMRFAMTVEEWDARRDELVDRWL
jgi:ribosomal-protein-alanine N-acetyltransferase